MSKDPSNVKKSVVKKTKNKIETFKNVRQNKMKRIKKRMFFLEKVGKKKSD